MSEKVRKLTELAVLTAVSLIIFVIELQIPNPFPIPGIKLGLANIITVYAVYHYKAHEVAAMVAVRLLLGAVFSGNFMALIYSASGAFLCLVGMLLLRRFIDEKHLWIASVLGAVLHNTGQMAAALIVTRTAQLLLYYPFLIVSGCLAGAFTGLCAQIVTTRLKRRKK
ncbi:MAG: Gx transporter family protein [Ruminococcus sp.]|nr:Gx transporter family protein [Ruminococcus sp.]MBQ1899031.1 Gx transporter family protein [Ruminococcus sp.]